MYCRLCKNKKLIILSFLSKCTFFALYGSIILSNYYIIELLHYPNYYTIQLLSNQIIVISIARITLQARINLLHWKNSIMNDYTSHGVKYLTIPAMRSGTWLYQPRGHVPDYTSHEVMYLTIPAMMPCTWLYQPWGHVPDYTSHEVMYLTIPAMRSCT